MGEGRERVAGFGPGKGEEGNVSVLTAPPETGRRLEEGRERNSPQPGTTCRRSTSREGPRSHRWGQTAPQTVKRQPQSMEGERGGRSLPPGGGEEAPGLVGNPLLSRTWVPVSGQPLASWGPLTPRSSGSSPGNGDSDSTCLGGWREGNLYPGGPGTCSYPPHLGLCDPLSSSA